MAEANVRTLELDLKSSGGSGEAPENARNASGMRNYAESVSRGFYGRHVGGLFGKHDNVRTYWEDQHSQFVLRPFVEDRMDACLVAQRGMRILDLGCGAGQGYELLTGIRKATRNHLEPPNYLLPHDRVETYYGMDLSQAMLDQARDNLAEVQGAAFGQADLSNGLGPAGALDPFDVYYSSYGSLSHLDGDGLRRLLVEISRHAKPGAIAVLDLVGRLSPEWPGYWREDGTRMLDYSMSYLYQAHDRAREDVEHFPLRFWTGPEVRSLAERVAVESSNSIKVLEVMDRSMFVGRHVDTGEYGCGLPPLRSLVNSLYELNVRTRLEDLRVAYKPVDGMDELNGFFGSFAYCWNKVVDFALERLHGERIELVTMDGWREFPPALQMAILTMDRVIDSVSWIDVGDVRANIVEPQLAYVLRRLEYAMQKGQGCGHGLLAVLRVGDKSA